MKLPLKIIPHEIITQYNLLDLQVNGWVYIRINKGMPGLKQAAKLANDRLVTHLAPYGYAPVKHTPSLWKHKSNGIVFSLVVDDFGIKATDQSSIKHLLSALKDKYEITVDETGSKYLGFTLVWDYIARTVDLSMPGYVRRALHKLQLQLPNSPQHAPHRYNTPIYGQKVQLAETQPTDPTYLPPSTKKIIQQIIGIFLYYGLALDHTLLVALGTLATQQANPTDKTWDDITLFLNYCATYPEATIRFTRSGMVMYIASDGSYLSESKARSRVGGVFYLSDKPPPS